MEEKKTQRGTFDVDAQICRAWKNFNRSTHAGVTHATKAYTDDVKYILAINDVVNWCKARSLKVKFCRMNDRSGGSCCLASRLITVTSRASLKYQLHVLLHECGHYLIEQHGINGKFDDPRQGRDLSEVTSLNDKLDIIYVELEAWHRGWKLALRIGALAPEDKATFDGLKADMMRTYLKWSMAKK